MIEKGCTNTLDFRCKKHSINACLIGSTCPCCLSGPLQVMHLTINEVLYCTKGPWLSTIPVSCQCHSRNIQGWKKEMFSMSFEVCFLVRHPRLH
ncbi:hypothetical protein ACHAW6_007289 [Cyclotella cf. meneghiniana]